jgi:hypothetical protein
MYFIILGWLPNTCSALVALVSVHKAKACPGISAVYSGRPGFAITCNIASYRHTRGQLR